MTVKEYVDLYLEIYDKLKLVNFNKEQVAMCILQEISKDKRGNEIEKNKRTYNSVLPATDKQLEYLKQLGIEVKLPLTRKGASDLIEKTKAEKIQKLTKQWVFYFRAGFKDSAFFLIRSINLIIQHIILI